MFKGLEHLCCGEMFREIRLFSLRKEGPRETSLQPSSTRRELIEKLWVPHPWRCPGPGCMAPWAF